MIATERTKDGYLRAKSSEGKKICVDGRGPYSEWVGLPEDYEKHEFVEADE